MVMTDQYFGMKELYQVKLKAADRMIIGNRQVEKGEPVTYFDHIQIANIAENVVPVAAKGGRNNDSLVIWEDRKEVTFRMSMGVLSDIGFALLTNARIMNEQPDILPIGVSEKIELDDKGRAILLNHTPIQHKDYPIFCFLYENKLLQKKVVPIAIDYENAELQFDESLADQTVMIDYYYNYKKGSSIYILERNKFEGMFELEGKFYRKGEMDGVNRTTLFKLPKVRIISNLNVTLGEIASPAVSSFNIIATPQRTQWSEYSVAEFYNLDEDVV